MKADRKKHRLNKQKISLFTAANLVIQFADKPILATGGLGFLERVSFSSVLFFKCHALVGFSSGVDADNGIGFLYFLEKSNGKWRIKLVKRVWIT